MFFLGVLTAILGTHPLRGQDPADPGALTLEQAVALAMHRNQEVLIAQVKGEALKGKIREVRADALPFLSLNGSALRWRDPAFLNASSFDKIPAEFREGLSPTGANLFDYNLSVSQPLYTSGKVGTALKLASLESEGTSVDRSVVEQDVRLRVIRAFYDLLLAGRLLDVARETVAQREEHVKMARARYEAGVATEVDVLRSQVSLANAQPELIRAENEVRRGRAALNNLLVRPINYPTVALGELRFAEAPDAGLDQIVRHALDRRPELQRLRINELEADAQKKLANAENRLRLDFDGQYGFSARDPANLGKHTFTRWIFTLSVGLPLFDGGRRSGLVQQAVAARRVAELQRAEAENDIRLEIQKAVDELERARRTVEAARLTVREAERVLAMMQDNYRYGAATTLDVTDSQTALSVARTNLLRGLYDHTLARAELRWEMGLDPLDKTHELPTSGK
ncbi:MAG: TolC family protein [Acidobacteria bacterium]|nr:TolC family protein [Acidobacteriota bacterium]